MRHFVWAFAGFFLCRMGLSAPSLTLLQKANPYGAIGEIGTLHLAEDGLVFCPVSNDFLGDTDKLMTGSLRLGYLQSWPGASLMTTLSWRSLTPIFKKKFGQEEMARPIGPYADWAEWQGSYRMEIPLYSPSVQVDYQLTLGLSHIGDKGIKYVHHNLHRLTRQSLRNLDYEDQPRGWSGSMGHQLGVIWRKPLRLLSPWHFKVFSGVYRSKLMFDLYGGVTAQTQVIGHRLSVEGRLIEQEASSFYEAVRPYRFELAAGLLLTPGLFMAVKRVSPYLRDDEVRQIYLELTWQPLPP